VTKPIDVLIGMEESGVVRRAMAARGYNAWSCDLEESEDGSDQHYKGDIRDMLDYPWDLAIFHPPCTHLAVSGARHFPRKRADGSQAAALDFVRMLLEAKIPRIALENPVSIISTQIRKPDQIIQPWMFGHGETKATCLWLKNLPLLVPTDVVAGREARIHHMPPGPDRAKNRSRTYDGIGAAMAEQWGTFVEQELRLAA
jgi:hypothetical protein